MADVSDYLSQRTAFIEGERSFRRDRVFYATATDEEKKAEALIRAIRKQEYTDIWNVEHEHHPNVFPGMEFLTGTRTVLQTSAGTRRDLSARDLITKTKLFQILTKVPYFP